MSGVIPHLPANYTLPLDKWGLEIDAHQKAAWEGKPCTQPNNHGYILRYYQKYIYQWKPDGEYTGYLCSVSCIDSFHITIQE